MNWEALGATGELVGALAVFLTLVYLAVQVRHSRSLLEENKRIALSQVHQARTQTRLTALSKVADSEHLAEVLSRTQISPNGIGNLDELSPVDITRLKAHFGYIYHHQDSNLYQGELGLLDERTLALTHTTIEYFMGVWEQLEIAGKGGTGRIEDYYAEVRRDA